ncbi:MAG: hypothetical protein KGM43_17310 [Planctomycetota bacterium]|nr:hypothetical protein [Planctomycetota bacterium]
MDEYLIRDGETPPFFIPFRALANRSREESKHSRELQSKVRAKTRIDWTIDGVAYPRASVR